MTGSQGFPIPDKHYRSSICCWSCSCCFDVGHWYSEETKDFWSAGRHLWFVLRTLGYSSFGSLLKFGSFFFQLVAILPLAIVHTMGNLFTNMSLGKVAVSFTHTIKAMEPFFSVVLSAIFLGEVTFLSLYKFYASYSTGFELWNSFIFLYWMAWQLPTVWVGLSLLPIVGGVALASLTEASFNWYVTITIIWIQVYLNLTIEDKSFCQMPYALFVSLCFSFILYYMLVCVDIIMVTLLLMYLALVCSLQNYNYALFILWYVI